MLTRGRGAALAGALVLALGGLAGQAATEAADEQLQLLRDIRGLLMEHNALLREVRGRVE